MRVFLVGYMGCGKTTVGKKLANKLGYQFADLDDHIQQRSGQTITEIFKSRGEDCFRKMEAEALRTLVHPDIVVATGGGCAIHHQNMDHMLQSGVTVYLKMSPEMAYSRLKDAKRERPLLKDLKQNDMLEWIKSQMAQREEYYAKAEIIHPAININTDELIRVIQSR